MEWIEFEGESFNDEDLTSDRFAEMFRDFEKVRFIRCSFHGSVFTEGVTRHCVFDTCDFASAMWNATTHRQTAFLNCTFRMTHFFQVKFVECKMTGSSFENTDLRGITVQGGDWSYSLLRLQNLKGLDFSNARCVETDFYGCNLEKCKFQGANLTHAVLNQAKLTGATFQNAILDGVDYKGIDFTGARIDMVHAVEFARAYGARVDEYPI
jgi:fluoroquinolone resistance protein